MNTKFHEQNTLDIEKMNTFADLITITRKEVKLDIVERIIQKAEIQNGGSS